MAFVHRTTGCTHTYEPKFLQEAGTDMIRRLHGIVWGPVLLTLLLAVGIIYTLRSGGFQMFGGRRLQEVFSERREGKRRIRRDV